MRQHLKVLFVEDDVADAELVAHALTRANVRAEVRRVDSRAAFEHALAFFQPDVVLSERGVPCFSALEALRFTQMHSPGTPFLLVSGTFDHETAQCVRAGAAGFVGKSDLQRLSTVIADALVERAQIRMLSTRQLEVLLLLAAGQTTRQAAEHLGVAVKTVEAHRATLMRRLGVRTIGELVRLAIRLGLAAP